MDQNPWKKAAVTYADWKGDNRYSLYCREFASEYLSGIDGLTVLDAGCGDGEYTGMIHANGAKAYGCDASDAVVARAREKHPGCRFDVADLSQSLPYKGDMFDLVFSNLVLMDVEPLDRTAAEFYRVVRPWGSLFFSITHPAFYLADWARDESGKIVSKTLTGYLTKREIEHLWGDTPVTHYHRPVSWYLNLFAGKGFCLSRLYEPSVYEAEKIPDIPLYLFAEFEKL